MNYPDVNTNLTQQLTANDGVPFRFGKDSSGNYGYILNQGGADTVIPFKKGVSTSQEYIAYNTSYYGHTFTIDKDVSQFVVVMATYFSSNQAITWWGVKKNNVAITQDYSHIYEYSAGQSYFHIRYAIYDIPLSVGDEIELTQGSNTFSYCFGGVIY